MKKFFIPFIITSLLMCGCSAKKQSSSHVKETTPTVTEPTTAAESVTETVQATENKPVERVLDPAEGTYVYDKANVLDKETFAACNDYAEWLYRNYLINSAVVTVSELEGLSPEDYAEKAYNELYDGRGSGLLLLINNATNNDILFRTGRCLTGITDEDERDAFYWSTKELVAGDYKTAIMRLMQLGEKCPAHIFDNAGVFDGEQSASLEAELSKCQTPVSLLATSNTTGQKNEELLKSYCERRYKDGKGIMILLDVKTSAVLAYSAEKLPDKTGEELKKACELAKGGKYEAAVRLVIEAVKG